MVAGTIWYNTSHRRVRFASRFFTLFAAVCALDEKDRRVRRRSVTEEGMVQYVFVGYHKAAVRSSVDSSFTA